LESEFNHFLPLIDPGGYVTVTGTRYSFADIYARIIKRESTKDNSNWVISVRECFKADGSLLFPERKIADGRNIGFTAELLAELQRNDPEMFGPQYLNKILAGKDQIFPTDILLGAVKSSKDAEFPATAPCIMMIDLAESTKAGADHSVVVIAKQDTRGRVWIVDCVGHTWTPAQTANVILTLMLQHRPYKILVEKQPGAEFFAEFLKATGREKGLNVPIDFIKGGRQKDAKYIRIAALENAFKNKRLFLCAGIKDFERLEEEFTQFPRGRHDDRPDCIALIVGHLSQNTFVELQPLGVRSPMSFLYPKGWDEPVDTTPSRNMCGDGFVG
jgi:predicted phage terminase large subunit-like protein